MPSTDAGLYRMIASLGGPLNRAIPYFNWLQAYDYFGFDGCGFTQTSLYL